MSVTLGALLSRLVRPIREHASGGWRRVLLSPPPPPLLVLTSLSTPDATSEELEVAERERQMCLFLDVLPPRRNG